MGYGIIFQFLSICNTIVGAGAVGGVLGAALRYGSGSAKLKNYGVSSYPQGNTSYK
jgi:hypothetical protein